MTDVEEQRGYQLKDVAAKTQALIEYHGFEFPQGSGQVFDLDLASQTKWTALRTLEQDISWPVEISPRSGAYSLALTDLDAFLRAGLLVVQSYKDSGRVLRLELEAATTMEELRKVVDDRV